MKAIDIEAVLTGCGARRLDALERAGARLVVMIDLDRMACVRRDWLAVIDAAEQARAQRFKGDAQRRRFVCAHAALRLVLAACLDCPAAAIRITAGPYGKPRLDMPNHRDAVEFNLSHSDARAVITVAHGRPIGIDIEMQRPGRDITDVAPLVLGDEELRRFRDTDPCRRATTLLRAWTAKEAVMKAAGLGFQCDPRGIALPADFFDSDGDRVAMLTWAGHSTYRVSRLETDACIIALAEPQ
jgi:phosphopantetheinyl transferase